MGETGRRGQGPVGVLGRGAGHHEDLEALRRVPLVGQGGQHEGQVGAGAAVRDHDAHGRRVVCVRRVR